MTAPESNLERLLRDRRFRFFLIFLAWTLNGLLFSSQLFVAWRGEEMRTWAMFGRALLWGMSYCYLWALATPLVLAFVRKLPLSPGMLIRNVSLHLCLSILVSFSIRFASEFVRLKYVLMRPEISLESLVVLTYTQFDYGLFMYWFIVLVAYTFQSYRKYREGELRASNLQTELARAQLESLKMQLHPHFLFNTLNAISVLIDKDPINARAMLSRLGELLRITLDHGGVQEVPLKQEMEFLDRYVAIQQIRFGDRMEVFTKVDPETYNASVPNLLLQPLVENAVEHGVAKRSGKGRVEIHASRNGEQLELIVRDNGGGLSGTEFQEGVGLSNTRARLRQLYGEQHSFTLKNADGSGLEVTIRIPFNVVTTSTLHELETRNIAGNE